MQLDVEVSPSVNPKGSSGGGGDTSLGTKAK